MCRWQLQRREGQLLCVVVALLAVLAVVVYQLGGFGEKETQLDELIVGYSRKDLGSEKRLRDLFQLWLRKHEKSYGSESATNQRFAIFKVNLRHIHSHNVQKPTPFYFLGLNNFADLTDEEFKTHYSGTKPPPRSENKWRKTENFKYGDVDPPASIDWRSKGAVTAIKIQGYCGCCWAFSAIGAVEGINAIHTGELVGLSEQQLVDCDKSNKGCCGGFADNAFKYIIENGGIDTERDYPYRAKDEACKRPTKKVVSIDDYADVPENNETALLQAVSKQPVSVAINTDGHNFKSYVKGIFTGPCGTELDHAVLVVGYGSSSGRDYWIIKNSYSGWGQDGYMFMERLGSNNRNGLCGINMLPSYPIKTRPNPRSADSSDLGGHQ